MTSNASMNWWAHMDLFVDEMSKCFFSFRGMWFGLLQAAETFENLKANSRLRCNITQWWHNKLLQVIESNCLWVYFQPLTNTRYFDLALAHNEIEFSQVTLHVPLAICASLTDNTVVVTWSWAWAQESFYSLCEKVDDSFIFMPRLVH